jgi:ATP-dependent protease ClpP protease subunit
MLRRILLVTAVSVSILTTVLLCTQAVFGKEFNPERAVAIVGPITPNTMSVLPQMEELSKSGDTIDLVISSPGGYVDVGFLLLTYIDNLRARGIKFRCFVPDQAASMAFQILLHCDERHVLNFSKLLFHRVRVYLGMGAVITGPDARTLANDLFLTDEVIFRELLMYLPADMKYLRYHFNRETDHTALNLCRTMPDTFKCHDSVPGLLPYLFSILNSESGVNQNHQIKEGSLIYMRGGN